MILRTMIPHDISRRIGSIHNVREIRNGIIRCVIEPPDEVSSQVFTVPLRFDGVLPDIYLVAIRFAADKE